MNVVAKLEDENRRLREQLSRQNHSDLPSPTETISITREELQCIKNLTDENIKYKRLIKSKDKEISQKNLDIEAVQSQLERLCKLNCTLRQKNTFSTNQTQRLIREKLELEVQLKEKENVIHQMKDRVTDDLISPSSPTVNRSHSKGINKYVYFLNRVRLWALMLQKHNGRDLLWKNYVKYYGNAMI